MQKFDSYDIEMLRRELIDTVESSRLTEVLAKLDEIRDELYYVSVESGAGRKFSEPGGVSDPGIPGPFEPVMGSEKGVDGFAEGYVQVGGFTVWVPVPEGEDFIANPAEKDQRFVAVRIAVSPTPSSEEEGSGGEGEGEGEGEDEDEPIDVGLVAYSNYEALRDAQRDLDYVVYPLYKLAWSGDGDEGQDGGTGDGGSGGETRAVCRIVMDLRRMPTTGMLETFLEDEDEDGAEETGS